MNKKAGVICLSDASDVFSEDAPLSIEKDQLYPIEIEIFREGKFKHRWYGDLDFNEEYLDKMIQNYNSRFIKKKISFDLDHDPAKVGAVAWLSDEPGSLYKKKKTILNSMNEEQDIYVLVAKVKLNSMGFDLIRGHRYKYFSCEIDPDYQSYEVRVEKGSDGVDIEKQMGSIGPTVISGGLTNNPFIPNLGAIEFSADSEHSEQLYHFSHSDEIAGIQFFGYSLKSEDKLQQDVSKVEPDVIKLEKINEDNMKFSELVAKATDKDLEGQIQVYSASLTELSDEEQVVAKLILSSLNEQKRKDAQVDEAIKASESAKFAAEEASRRLTSVENELKKAKENSYTKTVELYCKDLRELGCQESTIKYLHSTLSSMTVADREFKFSATIGEESVSFDLMKFAKDLIATLPTSAFLDQTEKFSANNSEDVPDKTTEVVPDKSTVASSEPQKNTLPEWAEAGHIAFCEKNSLKIEDLDERLRISGMFDNNGNLKAFPTK